jgi:peptidoglycan LD-endopeptidase LytH
VAALPAVLLAVALVGCELGTSRHLVRSPEEVDPSPPRTTAVVEQGSLAAAALPRVFDARPRTSTANPPPITGAVASLPADLVALSHALVVPVAGVLRSQLRDSYDEMRGDRLHAAMDIPARTGTPVLSASDGRVLKMHDSKPGGLMVYATDTSERFILLYGHLDAYADALRDGMPLARGQVIGYVGTTGNARADTPHLHFAILRGQPAVAWWEGVPVNPFPLLAR